MEVETHRASPAVCSRSLASARQHLRRQLELLRDGMLLAGPGVTFERVVDLDQQISELSTKIALGADPRVRAHLRVGIMRLVEESIQDRWRFALSDFEKTLFGSPRTANYQRSVECSVWPPPS